MTGVLSTPVTASRFGPVDAARAGAEAGVADDGGVVLDVGLGDDVGAGAAGIAIV